MVHPYTGDRTRLTVSFNARVETVRRIAAGDPGFGMPSVGVCVNCDAADVGESEQQQQQRGDGLVEGSKGGVDKTLELLESSESVQRPREDL